VQLNNCYFLIPSFLLLWFGTACPLIVFFAFIYCVQNSLKNFCSGGLVVTYCFSFCLSWKTFIAPSFLSDSFAGYSILGLKLFHSVPRIPHSMLFLLLSYIEKSAVILMGLPLYIVCFFSLTAFSILSLFSVLAVLIIICCGVVLFWSSLFGVLEVSYT
jgi:hypothetical protein